MTPASAPPPSPGIADREARARLPRAGRWSREPESLRGAASARSSSSFRGRLRIAGLSDQRPRRARAAAVPCDEGRRVAEPARDIVLEVEPGGLANLALDRPAPRSPLEESWSRTCSSVAPRSGTAVANQAPPGSSVSSGRFGARRDPRFDRRGDVDAGRLGVAESVTADRLRERAAEQRLEHPRLFRLDVDRRRSPSRSQPPADLRRDERVVRERVDAIGVLLALGKRLAVRRVGRELDPRLRAEDEGPVVDDPDPDPGGAAGCSRCPRSSAALPRLAGRAHTPAGGTPRRPRRRPPRRSRRSRASRCPRPRSDRSRSPAS